MAKEAASSGAANGLPTCRKAEAVAATMRTRRRTTAARVDAAAARVDAAAARVDAAA